jgi:lysophospholipase L1-like esterase
MRKIRAIIAKAALIVVASLIALFIGEIAVRCIAPQNLSGAWRVHSPSGNLINDAGRVARHQFGERVVSYRINEHHLRGGPIGHGKPRVLCVGDSYTFGWLVEEEKCFVTQLAARAPNLEFLNGGAGGWGTAQYVSFVEEFGQTLAPKAVVVFLNFDDIRRSLESGLWAWQDEATLKPSPAQNSNRLLKQAVRKLPAYQWMLEHCHLLQLARSAALNAGQASSVASKPDEKAVTDGVRLAQALFTRLHDWCRQHQAKLMVVNVGLGEVHWLPKIGDKEDEMNRAFVTTAPAFFASLGVPFVDMAAELKAAAKGDLAPYRIPVDLHFNEAGHGLFADVTWPHLGPLLAPLAALSDE